MPWGNGLVEENGLARLCREAPVNSIWEGSGHVNAPDVLRALIREPTTVAALPAELDLARSAGPRLDAVIVTAVSAMRVAAGSAAPSTVQSRARALVEQFATTLPVRNHAAGLPSYALRPCIPV